MQAARCIVFVGRQSRKNRYTAFDWLSERLAAHGLRLVEFESDRMKASRLADEQLDAWPALVSRSEVDSSGQNRTALRFFLKGTILMAGRERWSFVRAAFRSRLATVTAELTAWLDQSPCEQVLLVGHSAGAIAVTQVAGHSKVCGVVCFGYAFKHPDRPPEDYRTRHLKDVSKPLLIIQGTSDAYGSDPRLLQPLLPQQCRMVSPECDHDYFGFSAAESADVWSAIEDVLRQTRCIPCHHGPAGQ